MSSDPKCGEAEVQRLHELLYACEQYARMALVARADGEDGVSMEEALGAVIEHGAMACHSGLGGNTCPCCIGSCSVETKKVGLLREVFWQAWKCLHEEGPDEAEKFLRQFLLNEGIMNETGGRLGGVER